MSVSSTLTLVAAGILMVPPLLIILSVFPVIAVLSVPGLWLLCQRNNNSDYNNHDKKKKKRRAIITGGSSGIGLSVAHECLKKPEFEQIILLARNVEKLNQAKASLIQYGKKKKNDVDVDADVDIQVYSVDISSSQDLKKVANQIFATNANDETNNNDSIVETFLFCMAGISVPQYFDQLTPEEFTRQVQTNQLGTIFTIQAFLPFLKTSAAGGVITICSSMAGQVGTFGYSGYAPTKFALRGLAECLNQELAAYNNIHVCLAFPPDTDTPGFAVENQTKPQECRMISEDGGLAKPDDIAASLLQQITTPRRSNHPPPFFIHFSFDGWMLANLTAGFAPITTVTQGMAQVAGIGLFRVVSLFYLKAWTSAIREYAAQKKNGDAKTSNNNGQQGDVGKINKSLDQHHNATIKKAHSSSTVRTVSTKASSSSVDA